jgi:RNA polymerase sigma factor (sigma-70 family)
MMVAFRPLEVNEERRRRYLEAAIAVVAAQPVADSGPEGSGVSAALSWVAGSEDAGGTIPVPASDRMGMEDRAADSDVELLRAVSGGDTGALKVLYERHAGWMSVRLLRRCNDPGVVAEVLQDTFVAVWRGAAGFRGEGEVAGWLWGVAIRRLVSRLRAHRHPAEVLVAEVTGGNEMSVEERVLSGVEYGDLGAAVGRLSPEMRAVVQAMVLDGLSAREASTLLGVRPGTVKTRLHRAKAQLRRDLIAGLA